MANKIPSVLSFSRALSISDGMFYSVRNSLLNDKEIPIKAFRIGWVGTQDQNKKDGKNTEARNLGEVEVAKLHNDSSTLRIIFSFRSLPLKDGLFQIGEDEDNGFRADIADFYNRLLQPNSTTLYEIAKRVTINLINARWTWRNRGIAYDITTKISVNDKTYTFNALEYELDNFNYDSPEIHEIATIIADGWKGSTIHAVTVVADIETEVPGCEVYPSQLYLGKSPDDGCSKFLYTREEKHVGFRAEKDWNAMRTIDTWYDDFATVGTAIPIEPAGASLEYVKKFRQGKNKGNLRDFLKDLSVVAPNSDEEKFVAACLIRGGVFSEK